jgi:hypothetical protein
MGFFLRDFVFLGGANGKAFHGKLAARKAFRRPFDDLKNNA